MARPIQIEMEAEPEAEISLRDGRSVSMRSPRFRSATEMSWAARRPGWGDARASSNRLLGASLRPRMSAEEVGSLPWRDRERLMLEAVRMRDAQGDWRGLYGTTLSREERFGAVMRWAQRREAEQFQAQLRSIRKSLAGTATAELPNAGPGLIGRAGMARFEETIGLSRAYRSSVHEIAGLGNLGILRRFYDGFGANGVGELSRTIERVMGLSAGQGPLTSLQAGEAFGLTNRITELSKTTEAIGLGRAADRRFGLAESAGISRVFESLGSVSLGAELSALNDSVTGYLGANLRETNSALLQAVYRNRGYPGFAPGALEQIGGIGFDAKAWQLPGISDALRANLSPGLLGITAAESLGALRMAPGIFAPGRELRRTIDGLIVVEFRRIWSADPMWFLLNHLNTRELPQLLDKSQEQVYDAVFDALETVVAKTPVIAALHAALGSLPFLSPEQRRWLQHGLEHAANGEWIDAAPPLFAGFEGGLHSSALDAQAIAIEGGKLMPAEKIIKAFELGEELERFALRLIFGGRGNPFRHGRPQNESRDQVLLLIVGIVAWIDFLLDGHGTERLATELHEPLAQALQSPAVDRPVLEEPVEAAG